MGAMKPIKTLLVLASMLVPAIAAAQPAGYYGQPASTQLPGGFHNRQGRLAWGVGIGLGGMHDSGSEITSCNNCNYNPIAFEGHIHLGGFLGPRFALMGEAQVNAQTVHSDYYDGDTILSQNALMIAGQFWITPQLWVKGGIGFAHLQADDYYFVYDVGQGGVIMGAVGFEVMSARNFAVDLQGRLIQGAYNGLDDKVTSGTVGVGINWY
jgi:hypothetical protein